MDKQLHAGLLSQEIDSWLRVCKKLESNVIMMAMSIAYITQVSVKQDAGRYSGEIKTR